MSIPIITPVPITGFPLTPYPYSNIQPFTYRDGETYLSLVERLRQYVRDTIVPHVDESIAALLEAWSAEVLALTEAVNTALDVQSEQVNTALAAQMAEVTEALNAAIASIINSTIAVTDPVTLAIISDVNSATRLLLDSLYASKATQTTVSMGRLSDASLEAKYVQKSRQSVNVLDYGVIGDGVADDRANIQAALDAAGVNGAVLFPPSHTYLLKTKPAGDRVLIAKPGQILYGLDADNTVLKIDANFPDYKTLVGMATDATDQGKFRLHGLQFNQNASNGNGLNVASSPTYPRNVLRVVSNDAASTVIIQQCIFTDSSNVNTLYIAAAHLRVQDNRFTKTGLASTTTWYDHSTIYVTVTTEGGSQIITNNDFQGTISSGGATCAIETHGGSQIITGNTVYGYQIGANLTGYTLLIRAAKIEFTNNTLEGVLLGVQLWSYYNGSITDGFAARNMNVSNNAITIDRDRWLNITGLAAIAGGIITSEGSTSPMENITITNNIIEFKYSGGIPPANDSRSVGIKLATVASVAEMRNINVSGNIINNCLSTAIFLNGVIRRLRVIGNSAVDPASSTHSSVTTSYNSFCVITGSLYDVTCEGNVVTDTRSTHKLEHMFIMLSSIVAATNVEFRNNRFRVQDGTTPRSPVTPSSVAGTAPFVDEAGDVYSPIFQPTKVGSRVREISTGIVKVQTAAPSGATWVTATV